MKDRRTIRKYSDKNISEELLNELLLTACRASNTGNMQTYSIVITRDEENKKKLAPAHFNQPMVVGAPVVLTFCADYNRFSKWCKLRGAEPGYDNFQSFVAAFVDTVAVAQAFCDAAESHGLGICYLGTTTYNADKITDALNLPELVVPVTTITVGYSQEIPAQVERLPLEAIIHNEVYCDYSSDMINELYEEKESLEANKSYVEENNKPSLAHVFTDIRYTKANSEYFSKVFLDLIKRQKFLD